MLDTIPDPDQLDSHTRHALSASVLRCGTLLLQALHVASTAAVYGPTLDDRAGGLERARELMLLLEQASLLYRDLSDADLSEHANRQQASVAVPGSWLEVAVAQLLVGLAVYAAFDRHAKLTGVSSEAMRSALACQVEHCNAARAALDELARGGTSLRAALRGSLDRWLSLILPVLGEAELRQRYLLELDRVTRELGIAH